MGDGSTAEILASRRREQLEWIRLPQPDTRLISLHVKAGATIESTINLAAEIATAASIRNDRTREQVLGALRKLCRHADEHPVTYVDRAIFCSDKRLVVLQPDTLFDAGRYWCDSTFHAW